MDKKQNNIDSAERNASTLLRDLRRNLQIGDFVCYGTNSAGIITGFNPNPKDEDIYLIETIGRKDEEPCYKSVWEIEKIRFKPLYAVGDTLFNNKYIINDIRFYNSYRYYVSKIGEKYSNHVLTEFDISQKDPEKPFGSVDNEPPIAEPLQEQAEERPVFYVEQLRHIYEEENGNVSNLSGTSKKINKKNDSEMDKKQNNALIRAKKNAIMLLRDLRLNLQIGDLVCYGISDNVGIIKDIFFNYNDLIEQQVNPVKNAFFYRVENIGSKNKATSYESIMTISERLETAPLYAIDEPVFDGRYKIVHILYKVNFIYLVENDEYSDYVDEEQITQNIPPKHPQKRSVVLGSVDDEQIVEAEPLQEQEQEEEERPVFQERETKFHVGDTVTRNDAVYTVTQVVQGTNFNWYTLDNDASLVFREDELTLASNDRPIKVRKQGEALGSIEFMKETFSPLNFTGKWLALIGKPTEPFKIMIYGKAGCGKSTLSLQLAQYLAEEFGKKVLYVCDEEKFSGTLQEKMNRLKIGHRNLYLVDVLPQSFEQYDVVCIDSVNSIGIEPETLRKLDPSKSYVYIFQATKDGKFRGSEVFEHDVDTSIKVEQMKAVAIKSRFGGHDEVEVC